jgi:hypothetical protein
MPIKDTLRAIVVRAEVQLQRATFASIQTPSNGWATLIGISFPKSGTHLLDQMLLGFSKVAPFATRLHSFYAEYEGESGRKRDPQQALAWIDSLRPLDVASAHLFARPEAIAKICSPKFIPYFIFRDPRDVVVSHVFYVTDMEAKHVHHNYYQSLRSFEERLNVSILGLPNSTVEFPDIAKRFEMYTGWLDHPEVLSLHFEDFVHDRSIMLNRIADHFLKRIDTLNVPRATILDALESSINPKKSPTFRSGKTGEWKKYFNDDHKRIFKDAAGDLLVKLGYEKNNDW